MKLRSIATTVLVLIAVTVVGVSSASAYYYVSYNQAKHATKEDAVASCERYNDCSGYAVGTCRRVTQSRVDCVEALFHETAEGEVECNTVTHWGVAPGGYLKPTYGKPYCFYVQ